MAIAQNKIESDVIELSTASLKAFCNDISGMFGINIECDDGEVFAEKTLNLKKRFKNLVAVNTIKADGALSGTFHIIFDQEGLFTIAGVIIMLPEQRILTNRKTGSAEEATAMSDALKEAGNLMVGSWDRIFREGFEGHRHFIQTNTFIGKPWDKPEEKIALASDMDLLVVSYKITVGSYPAFKCGVLFPKAIFVESTTIDNKTPATEPSKAVEEQPADKAEIPAVGIAEEQSERPVTETIRKMTESPAVLPGEQTCKTQSNLACPIITAKEIMQKDIVWGNPEDSVQQALTKIQQQNACYIMVGKDGLLEGLVSSSDLKGAVSPYLRPMFAKWHRPMDDATLQIKIKWIMSKPVRTIALDTPLLAIMENMSRFGGKCLPVVNHEGKVQGMVTVLDIFKAFLHCNSDFPGNAKISDTPSSA